MKNINKKGAGVQSSTWKALLVIAIAVGLYYHQILLNKGHFWDDYNNCAGPRIINNCVSLAQGNLPVWLSNIHGGFPNVDAFTPYWSYPGILPLSLLVNNNTLNSYWLEVCMVGHVVLLGWFMFFFFRHHKIKYWVAILGGIATCLSGQFVYSQVWVCVVMGFCWLPLVLIFADKYFETGKFKNVLWAGLFTGLIYLAGHSQWSVYAYLFICLYLFIKVIFTCFENRNFKIVKRFIIILLIIFPLAFLVSANRLLPELEITSLSQKVAGNNWQKGTQWKLLATTVFPHAFGKVDGPGVKNGDWKYWGLPGHYEGQIGFWHYYHLGSYAGLLPLILFFVAIFIPRKSKTLWALIIIEIGIVLFAYGESNWFRVVVCNIFPPLKMFRFHVRMATMFTSMLLPMVFTFVFNKYINLFPEERLKLFFSGKKKIFVGTAIAFILLLVTFVFCILWKGAPGAIEKGIVTQDYFIIWLIISAAFVLFYIHIKGKINSQALCVSFIVLIWIDLYHSTGKFNCAKNSLEEVNKPNQVDNILINARDQAGLQNKFRSTWNGHQANIRVLRLNLDSLNGYLSIWIEKILEIKNFARKNKKMERLFDLYNVKFDINKAAKTQKLEDRTRTMVPRVYTVHDVKQADWPEVINLIFTNIFNPKKMAYISENIDVQPEKYNRDKIKIKKYESSYRQIDVSMVSTGLLALSEHNYPGWKAKIDGQPTKIVDVNGIFMGIEVPTGDHEIEIYFAPKSVYLGMAISGITWCFFGIFFIKEKVFKAK